LRTISCSIIFIIICTFYNIFAQVDQRTMLDLNRLRLGYVYHQPVEYNPLISRYEYQVEIEKLIFGDGLFVTGEDGQIQPGIALRVREEDDRVWTITLQPDIFFHDGSSLEAGDVKFTYDLYQKFALQAPKLFMARYIESVRVINTYTIQFILKEPLENFPIQLGQLPILDQERYADWIKFEDVYRLPFVNPVGIGPFIYRPMTSNKIRLDVYREYFRKQSHLDGIDILFFESYDDLLNAFVQEKVDVIEVEDKNIYRKINQITSAANFSWIKRNDLKLHYILFNTQRRPFNDLSVRKALNQAINKNLLVERNLPDKSYVAENILDANSEAYFANPRRYKYDPLNSKNILDNLGFVKQRNGKLFRNGRELKFEIYYETGSAFQESIIRLISISLGELGINVLPRPLTAAELENRVFEGNYQAVLRSFSYIPANSLKVPRQFYLEGLNSVNGYKNISERRLDVVIQRSERTYPMNALIPLLQRIQFLYYDYAPCVFLFFEHQVYYAIHNRFENTKIIIKDNLNVQTKLTPKYKWYVKKVDQNF
jgi:peptide/nickel transport system substrate-binding protein